MGGRFIIRVYPTVHHFEFLFSSKEHILYRRYSYMQLLCNAQDGSTHVVDAREVVEIIPYSGVLASSNLRPPYDGVLHYRSELVFVRGPLPDGESGNLWLVVLEQEAYITDGVPELMPDHDAQELPSEFAQAA